METWINEDELDDEDDEEEDVRAEDEEEEEEEESNVHEEPWDDVIFCWSMV